MELADSLIILGVAFYPQTRRIHSYEGVMRIYMHEMSPSLLGGINGRVMLRRCEDEKE